MQRQYKRQTAISGFLIRVTISFSSAALTVFMLAGCHDSGLRPAAQCPQMRVTEQAPEAVIANSNPLPPDHYNMNRGKALYHDAAEPVCTSCHGKRGDGRGILADRFAVSPRDFTCASTMHAVSDGQLYWIIKNGSPETNMPAYDQLDEEALWQLVMYVRQFAPLPDEMTAPPGK